MYWSLAIFDLHICGFPKHRIECCARCEGMGRLRTKKEICLSFLFHLPGCRARTSPQKLSNWLRGINANRIGYDLPALATNSDAFELMRLFQNCFTTARGCITVDCCNKIFYPKNHIFYASIENCLKNILTTKFYIFCR